MNKSWTLVFLAGTLEVAWVTGLKHSTLWWQWGLTAIAIAISFDTIIRASRVLPLGTVYAVFAGLGTAGTVLAEMLLFGEPVNGIKITLILVLLAGVIGLKMITKEKTSTEPATAQKGGDE
ncbi:multidrug efflux SMR transporter [Paenibacillus sp. N1-5-1-14]|uniref:DMT family transporter n=1 Tax=Paenibacillus radicibacter TaxID=2972488 RepID=UPI002158F977|nr:multidrug efflux SMR transporter [Paenibacillus radicibacter]MCR8642634.1 multidrug efflux SMR transporter [Paenibacillus radicibacter]